MLSDNFPHNKISTHTEILWSFPSAASSQLKVGSLTVIIGLISVQGKLICQLELSLAKTHTKSFFWSSRTISTPNPCWEWGNFVSKSSKRPIDLISITTALVERCQSTFLGGATAYLVGGWSNSDIKTILGKALKKGQTWTSSKIPYPPNLGPVIR